MNAINAMNVSSCSIITRPLLRVLNVAVLRFFLKVIQNRSKVLHENVTAFFLVYETCFGVRQTFGEASEASVCDQGVDGDSAVHAKGVICQRSVLSNRDLLSQPILIFAAASAASRARVLGHQRWCSERARRTRTNNRFDTKT